MDIDTRLWSLLSSDEQSILEEHFDLLAGLADGRIAPRTANQRRFVDSCSKGLTNPEGRSENAWQKYQALESLDSELKESTRALHEEIRELRRELEQTRSAKESIEVALERDSLYIEILESSLPLKAEPDWDNTILNKLPPENREILLRYGRLFVFRRENVVTAQEFQDFLDKTTLWKAIHNYKKLGGAIEMEPEGEREKRLIFSPDPSPPRDPSYSDGGLCPSCGGPTNGGYCRCFFC